MKYLCLQYITVLKAKNNNKVRKLTLVSDMKTESNFIRLVFTLHNINE